MILNFFPKEVDFYALFERHIGYTAEAAKFLKELVSKGEIDETSFDRVQLLEHEADEVALTIIDHLNKTFITPFDREDIHSLTKELDDVIDMITAIVNRLIVYKINGVNKDLVEFATLIEESVLAVQLAVKGLRTMKKTRAVTAACAEVNRLENVGDALRDRVLGDLLEYERDPIVVIKWKDVYQEAETVLDICEDVAHVVSSILVKQA